MKPQARAIILADQVYRDVETGKCVIAGTFNRVAAGFFPVVHPSLTLYLNLMDFVGKVELRVRLVKDKTGESMVERKFPVESADRLLGCEVTVRLANLTFSEPGRYSFEVYSGDDYLGHLPIELVQHKPEGGRGKTGDPKGI